MAMILCLWLYGMAPLAQAQLLGQVGRTIDDVTGAVGETVGRRLEDAAGLAAPVRNTVRQRLDDLLRNNARALEPDDRGFPVVRGEVLAIVPDQAALERAEAAGFRILGQEVVEGIDTRVVRFAVPGGMTARAALEKLRAIDPHGEYDLNHIYTGAGAVDAHGVGRAASATGGTASVGLVDSGVAAHPALDGLIAAQRGFAPGGIRPAAHGTAVASLLVGRAPGFQGAASGRALLVADVYGNGPTGGSADAVARALGWMAARKIRVVNISLVGPPNALVRAAVAAVLGRGVLLVAAVGNDGPAAAPLYPASYPGVIAVTAVDRRGRVLPEAGRASHVDFAAPGADMTAADIRGGYSKVRGTSFAAPLVAGRLAMLAGEGGNPVDRLSTEAADPGVKGRDTVYGAGLVCGQCRNNRN